MEKYDNMINNNKKIFKAKEELAVQYIKLKLENNQQVCVSELQKKTGLSRSFFYNNPVVREELDKARKAQKGKDFTTKQKVVIDRALERENQCLKKKLEKMRNIIDDLKKENENLRKKANAKTISMIEALKDEL